MMFWFTNVSYENNVCLLFKSCLYKLLYILKFYVHI